MGDYLGAVIIGKLLQILFGLLHVVLGRPAVVCVLFDLFHRVTTDMANRHAAILGHLLDDLHELLAAFLAQFRKEQTDILALNRR